MTPSSVNHMLAPGPAAIATGELSAASPRVRSVISPAEVTWPMAPEESANHASPLRPAAIPSGWLPARSPRRSSEIRPFALIRPTAQRPLAVAAMVGEPQPTGGGGDPEGRAAARKASPEFGDVTARR